MISSSLGYICSNPFASIVDYVTVSIAYHKRGRWEAHILHEVSLAATKLKYMISITKKRCERITSWYLKCLQAQKQAESIEPRMKINRRRLKKVVIFAERSWWQSSRTGAQTLDSLQYWTAVKLTVAFIFRYRLNCSILYIIATVYWIKLSV